MNTELRADSRTDRDAETRPKSYSGVFRSLSRGWNGGGLKDRSKGREQDWRPGRTELQVGAAEPEDLGCPPGRHPGGFWILCDCHKMEQSPAGVA